ncbi:hypothetical protein M3P36_07180 [Altererythrobacter sp. KTW20L]|uniref:hypothetical protein n=1 Tax=Altererythrobacter sp. KTW20L TaxID=2942210 RepID=UPI0020BE4A8A|nr:hypothetical protein [Altererythrobacter sp. KTW20L]MCL6250826.1 hypothetical protein [Altererythrobacter sp. KTW20L]
MKYVAIDTESSFDPYLREAYSCIEPDQERARGACRVITAASAYEFELDEEGRVSTGPLVSWTAHDHSEAQILGQLSNHLISRPSHVVITWGGASADVVRLTLACMGHDLPLPAQLQREHSGRWSRQHVDVGAAMTTARTGKYHHLSGILIRLDIPVGLLLEKACLEQAETPAEWNRLRQHCELDSLFASIAFLAWRRVEGAPGLRVPEPICALIAGYLRQRPGCNAEAMLAGVGADMAARV